MSESYGVIVLQTSSKWNLLCQEALAQSGLPLPDGSVALCDSLAQVPEFVRPNVDQLLITGSANGTMSPIHDLILRMRKVNPQLGTASFTSRRGALTDRTYFDTTLPKRRYCEGDLGLCDPIIRAIKHHFGL